MRAKGPRRPNRMKIGAMEISHIFGRRGAVDIAMNIVLQDLVEDELLVLINLHLMMKILPHEAKEL
jgi:hypothetical protein